MSNKKIPEPAATSSGTMSTGKVKHENNKYNSTNRDGCQIEKRPTRRKGRRMEGQEKPAFWAVIPAQVRYDENLPPNAKLLYAEISSLTDQTGYCFASNAYFRRLFGLSERTVQNLLKSLRDRGYIRILDGDGGSGRRKIYAGINPLSQNPAENCGVTPQKIAGVPAKNCGDNIKDNKKENNPPTAPKGSQRAKSKDLSSPEWKPARFAAFWKFYPVHKSRQAAVRAWDRLKPADELIAQMGKALRRQMATDEWKRGVGIPYPATYLNQRRWEDEIGPSIQDQEILRREEARPEWI